MKILILGGYGTFGGRLAHLLADEPRLTLIIAGRSEKKAKEFCDSFESAAKKIPAAFDRNKDVEARIKEISPNLVVDATGPYQIYGNDPYQVIRACMANRVDYMDLADGSDFVRGIRQFDEQAKAKNVYILSGVSSLPVLSSAVVRRLSKDFTKITSIKGGISPSPYAGVGLNVIRALTSYAGKRIPLTRNGQSAHAYALTETMRYTIAPPGHIPLGNMLFSLVDVPDLTLLPELWRDLDSIWLGAGPIPELYHRMLIVLAHLVRMKMISSLLPLAPLFHFVINNLRWGEHRGGMFIYIEGINKEGKHTERSWHLIAEGNDGPFIPSMAIEAILRRALAGKQPSRGARAATQEIELEDYESIFSKRRIYTGERDSSDEEHAPLYKRILGTASSLLPPPLAEMHTFHALKKARGIAQIETGTNPFARLAGVIVGFPKAGTDIPVQVTFSPQNNGELWHRTFGEKSFSSFQWQGTRAWDKLLCERFGPFTFGMALVTENGRLKLTLRRWSLAGISLPLFLAPQEESYEYVENDRFWFNVKISHTLLGLIVHYRGWLVPQP